MLTLLDKQGSAARYSKQLSSFTKSLGKSYKPSACERKTGITEIAKMKGEIMFGSLLKKDNMEYMKIECRAWGIDVTGASVLPPNKKKPQTWTEMKKKIEEIMETYFYNIDSNRGKELPYKFKQTFKQRSGVVFVEK
mmetsp:Transcript_47939/g.55305  ORF Transcript_47939/g.55305 Transcript_47939/m.55305 type:complete len:137 (+) Transcript_47939:376-786(+)